MNSKMLLKLCQFNNTVSDKQPHIMVVLGTMIEVKHPR
jgi:hypothetical protein